MLQEATTRLPVDPNAFFYLADAAERSDHPEIARQALLDFRTLAGERARRPPRDRDGERIGNLSMRASDPEGRRRPGTSGPSTPAATEAALLCGWPRPWPRSRRSRRRLALIGRPGARAGAPAMPPPRTLARSLR